MSTTTRIEQCNGEVLYMALELSAGTWKVGTKAGAGQKAREKTVRAGDLAGLKEEIERAKRRFGLSERAGVMSCYEAGRDGFWIHRYLGSIGVINVVVDPASVDVNRRKRRAKTDRLDLVKLLSSLIRWCDGEKKVWSVVRVPEVGDEDARHFHREREGLKKERTQHINRMRSLLVLHGVKMKSIGPRFMEQLARVRQWDGSELPSQVRRRLEWEYRRLELVNEQLKELAKQRAEAVRRSNDSRIEKVRKLERLRGVGEAGSWTTVMELFAWRKFDNRKQVGSMLGLTGTPSSSGEMNREQGIDKAGSPRLRSLMIEMAWSWVRYQPHSELTKWFNRRFGGSGKRMRRIGIVAVARRLAIALWRYLEQDIVPAGAIIKAA